MTLKEVRTAKGMKSRVRVTASDYGYNGFVVSVFKKSSGKWRCVIEDDCGRLFIHNPTQINQR